MPEAVVLMSDIHSNLEALEAVCKDMPPLPIYCLGDLVGYGANPSEVIQVVKVKGATVVMGNHDYAAVTGDTEWFNTEAASAVEWTRRQLSLVERKYLSRLPRHLVIELGGLKILLVHGSPSDPLFEYVYPETHEYLFDIYLKSSEVNIIAMGHTHIPYTCRVKSGYIVNPGSVGQPRSGKPDASYLIVTVEEGEVKLEPRYVKYDIKTTADKIRDAGLPAQFAARLYRGL